MKTLYLKLILFLTSFTVFSNVYAQTLQKHSQKFGKHVSITALLSPAGKGPLNDLEENMRASGFGHTSPRECVFFFCIPETNHPKSGTGLAWRTKATYHIDSSYGISLTYSGSDFGYTRGYNSNVGRLNIEHSLRSVSPQLTLGVYDIISLGAGPALYFLKIRDTKIDTFQKHNKIGADISLNFRIPKKSLFFVTLDLNFKWVGTYSVGPYSKSFNDTVETFRETKVNYNHLSVGYGFGLRI